MICTISSYQLGSGEARILSRRSINDGRWHKITAVRYDCVLLLCSHLLLHSAYKCSDFLEFICVVLLFSHRTGKDGYLQIDGGAQQNGQSKGKSLMVNTKGSIYIGAWNGNVKSTKAENGRII